MKRLVAIAVAGVFLLVSQGPGRAQKEVAPPPIPPMLEGNRPLERPETKEPAPPQKQEEKAVKGKSAKTQSKTQTKNQPKNQKKNPKKANVKQQAAKKPPAAAKKKNPKASKKKRPAETPQAGPEEG